MNPSMLSITAIPPQPEAGIALWLIDLASPAHAPEAAILSSSERERAARFRFERDTRRYVNSHIGLRRILGQALHTPPADLVFEEGSHGKPRLAPSGRSNGQLHFNMSHSGDWALVGLGRRGPIGVDIEVMTPLDDADLLAQKNFSAAEYAAFRGTAPEHKLAAFFRCWTRKEACLKALGSGLSIEPQAFEAGLDTQARDTAIRVADQPCDMTVYCVDLPIDALAAVASLRDPFSPLAM